MRLIYLDIHSIFARHEAVFSSKPISINFTSVDSKERTRTTASSGYASQSQERSVPRGNESPTRTETNTERNQDGPGFWSGASLGGILGYMFGSRGNRGYRQVFN